MFVIFEKSTTKIVRILRKNYWTDAKFATEGAARAAFTRLAKQGKVSTRKHAILSTVDFAKIEKQEERINLMSGKPFMTSVNTPACCDPSTETYWSM